MQKHGVDFDICRSYFESYISENSKSYPMGIGDDMTEALKCRMTLFLVCWFVISNLQKF